MLKDNKQVEKNKTNILSSTLLTETTKEDDKENSTVLKNKNPFQKHLIFPENCMTTTKNCKNCLVRYLQRHGENITQKKHKKKEKEEKKVKKT